MEKPEQHIVRNNMIGLLASAVVLGLATKFVDEGAVVVFGLLYLGQAFVNLLLALAHIGKGSTGTGPAPYLLSMFLVLIIGFGACSGIILTMDNFLQGMH